MLPHKYPEQRNSVVEWECRKQPSSPPPQNPRALNGYNGGQRKRCNGYLNYNDFAEQ
jgi:hypothetical protein